MAAFGIVIHDYLRLEVEFDPRDGVPEGEADVNGGDVGERTSDEENPTEEGGEAALAAGVWVLEAVESALSGAVGGERATSTAVAGEDDEGGRGPGRGAEAEAVEAVDGSPFAADEGEAGVIGEGEALQD